MQNHRWANFFPQNFGPPFLIQIPGMRFVESGRRNFLDVFCARVCGQVGGRGPVELRLNRGIESKSRRDGSRDDRNWPSSLSCAVDPLPALHVARRVVNLSPDILDHCTPHYVFVYVRGDRVPTISRFHSAISAFRAPLRSKECPTGSARRKERPCRRSWLLVPRWTLRIKGDRRGGESWPERISNLSGAGAAWKSGFQTTHLGLLNDRSTSI